jgi:hypothetical protein
MSPVVPMLTVIWPKRWMWYSEVVVTVAGSFRRMQGE